MVKRIWELIKSNKLQEAVQVLDKSTYDLPVILDALPVTLLNPVCSMSSNPLATTTKLKEIDQVYYW